MHTLYDWLTLALFSALALLFLHRSFGPAIAGDRAVAYLPPALGCIAADLLGNAGHGWPATILLIATGAYLLIVLKPFRRAG